jgi:hypothetical protein
VLTSVSGIQTENGRKAQEVLGVPEDRTTPMEVAINGMVDKVSGQRQDFCTNTEF